MSNSNFRIRNGDFVEVIAGNYKKAQGRVIQLDVDRQQVIVENVRMTSKHIRRTQQNPNGGIVKREGPIHVSNVKLIRRADGESDRESKNNHAV